MTTKCKKLLASAALLLSAVSVHAGQMDKIDASGSAVRAMVLPPSQQAKSSVMLASGAVVDQRHIALVDYANLYCLDTKTASIRLVSRPHGLTGQWVPTGVTSDPKTHRVYVANYYGNNIIEGSLDCAKGEFSVKSVISSPESISPENVALSADGKILASANFDGGTVTAFERREDGWRQIWANKVSFAHAVSIIGANVYATSLDTKAIYKYEAHTGKLLAQVGSMGVDPLKAQHMWPTGLTNFDGTLVLTDAQTGYVCSINQQTLQSETCFGGNGLGPTKFIMPYGVVQRGKNLLVMSTFSSRVAEAEVNFSRGTMKIIHDWYWTGDQKLNRDFVGDRTGGEIRTVAFQGDPYSSVCVMPTWLPGFSCGYSALANDTQSKFLRFPGMSAILPSARLFYFVQSFPGRSAHDTYFFSVSTPNILNLRLVDGVPYIFSRRYVNGLQSSKEELISPTRTIQKDQIRSDFDHEYADLVSKRNKGGVVPLADAAAILAPLEKRGEFRDDMKAALDSSKSAEGAKFLADYLHCTGDSCDADMLRKDALAFAAEQLKASYIQLDRLVIPCMLTNAKCGPVLWKALTEGATPN